MIALILAAGRGSRLRELTSDKPKCLVSLAGRPLLHWQYDALCAAGAQRLLIVRGYLAERLVPEAAGLPADAFETTVNPQWEHSNMLSSLLCAAPWLEAAFAAGEQEAVISYADIVYPAAHVRALCTPYKRVEHILRAARAPHHHLKQLFLTVLVLHLF